MTFEDKTKRLEGLNLWQTKPSDNQPSIMMTDGPHGIREKRNDDNNTQRCWRPLYFKFAEIY